MDSLRALNCLDVAAEEEKQTWQVIRLPLVYKKCLRLSGLAKCPTRNSYFPYLHRTMYERKLPLVLR